MRCFMRRSLSFWADSLTISASSSLRFQKMGMITTSCLRAASSRFWFLASSSLIHGLFCILLKLFLLSFPNCDGAPLGLSPKTFSRHLRDLRSREVSPSTSSGALRLFCLCLNSRVKRLIALGSVPSARSLSTYSRVCRCTSRRFFSASSMASRATKHPTNGHPTKLQTKSPTSLVWREDSCFVMVLSATHENLEFDAAIGVGELEV
mmetsp:Transcript_19722/g.38580  ORF Transcript_19722/g.38580 Transcript_19722/m.38580 type:complete len:207 (+) Transcript_19722:2150-2770(+)